MYEVTTGTNRFDGKIQRVKYTWEELLAKFSNPVVTTETFNEYLAASKKQQGAIKDHGWILGGIQHCRGYRAENPIDYRSLLTIDMEDCETNIYHIINDYMVENKLRGCCHSTHKHTNTRPRLRLIIPFLDKFGPTSNAEYDYVIRRFCDELIPKMKSIDRTTFQPTRFMYWPTRSRDGDWYFRAWEGEELKKTKYIDEQGTWKNRERWPLHYLELDEKKFTGVKQQDGTTKDGVIGMFCRNYSITRVLEEIIPNIYEQTSASANRYTYIAGSTYGGAVIYDDDKFLQSWHSTDKACGLRNAFDLVRIHKFEGNINKTIKFVANLPDIKKEIEKEKFGENYEDWKAQLHRKENGKCYNSYDNIELILSNITKIKYNIFAKQYILDNKKAWHKDTEFLEDIDFSELHKILEVDYDLITTMQKIENTIKSIGRANAYHPIKEYLESLVWDGRPRIENLLQDIFGITNNEYYRTIIRKFMIAAVTRIYRPGIKYDHVLTLVGPTDIGKSSFFRVLFGEDYFTDSITLNSTKDKTGSEQLAGAWCVEFAELAGMSERLLELIKGWITRQKDTYRPAFGRVLEIFHRSCVLGATTNNLDGFLTDLTGNRRWWIVKCGDKEVNQEYLASIRDQLWAEAMYLYTNTHEEIYIKDKKIKDMARKLQDECLETDGSLESVKAYLEMPVPDNWNEKEIFFKRDYINRYLSGRIKVPKEYKVQEIFCIAEIWVEVYKEEPTNRPRKESNNIARILKKLGYAQKGRVKEYYGQQRAYERGKQ